MVEFRCALIFSVKIGGCMRGIISTGVALLWLLSIPTVCVAQSTPSAAQPSQQIPPQRTQLSPVVVTATRTEVPLAETAASVTVITDEEIQQQHASTVAEAL